MADQTAVEQTTKKPRIVDRTLIVGSLLFCGAITAVYLVRADALAAVTVCPPWVWSIPGLAAAFIVWVRRRSRWGARLTAAVWGVYLIALSDTPSALVRSATRPIFGQSAEPTVHESAVRVVSLNCGGFGHRSARDVVEQGAQIVLLQESPGREETAELAREMFGERGGYLWNSDASIVADGVVTPSSFNDRDDIHSACAQVRLTSGAALEVVSLRLEPAIVRLDFWSPACWRSQTENRRQRRRQLQRITARLENLPRSTPLILGGDFNAPAGDAIFDELKPRLRDAYREAGAGWGNTIINEAPFARIDQIWIDGHWEAREVRAQRTLGSDHRMVIADVTLKLPEPLQHGAVGSAQ